MKRVLSIFVLLIILISSLNFVLGVCTDFDGTDIYTKGTITLDGGVELQDYCDGDNIIEYTCEADESKLTSYSCPNGCTDGACIADCDESQTIMRLSSETNAHGQNATIGTYEVDICYGDVFGSDYLGAVGNVCDGKNNILNLSADTNAHADFTGSEFYSVPVCFGNVNSCEYVENGETCDEGQTCVVKMSGITNAHLSTCDSENDYGMICCNGGSSVDAYWADSFNNRISSETEIIVNNSNLKLVLSTGDSSLAGQEVEFTLYEDDFFKDNPIGITLITTIDGNGNAVYDWNISQDEYDLLINSETGEPYDLYFKDNVVVRESNTIDVFIIDMLQQDECVLNSIDQCESYTSSEECLADVCSVADNNPRVTCGQTNTLLNTDGTLIWYDCFCSWNETDGICKSASDVYSDEGTGDELIGTCIETQNTDDDCDDDGFLTYTWIGDWTWATGITPDLTNEDYQNCINDVGQEVTVSCPSYTRLTFISWQNLTIAVVIIFIIYLVIKFTNKNKFISKKNKK